MRGAHVPAACSPAESAPAPQGGLDASPVAGLVDPADPGMDPSASPAEASPEPATPASTVAGLVNPADPDADPGADTTPALAALTALDASPVAGLVEAGASPAAAMPAPAGGGASPEPAALAALVQARPVTCAMCSSLC